MHMISTKDFVLYLLKQQNGFVSGEEISEKIGISRAAVNTAVKTLRSEGYSIESSTNKGYCLTEGEEHLILGEILPFLSIDRAKRVIMLDNVTSTNTFLKKAAGNGAEIGTCVIADAQTAGKGRFGRHFESAKGAGIYLSYLLDTAGLSPAVMSEITAWGAVAVREAIEKVCEIPCGIKWVNDLVINRKKVCGILTELSVEAESGRIQTAVMGIGMNVNQDAGDFSSEIRPIATSLKIEAGQSFSRAKLCAEIIKRLDQLCRDFPSKREYYLTQYRKHTVILGKSVTVIRGEEKKQGRAVSIDNHFGLTIQYKSGQTETVTGGEVSIKGFYE